MVTLPLHPLRKHTGQTHRCIVVDRSYSIMQNWSIEDRLPEVRVPAFVINGRQDQATDKVVAPFFKYIPKVKWVTFEQSSHMPFWEERERYMKLVGEFLEL